MPDHFQRESGLGVGDKFAVIPPQSSEHAVEYEIAGVVSMDGWHWMSKNLRRGRAAGLMFAPYREVRRDFGIQRVTHFWMNLDGTATEDEIKAPLQTIAQRNFDGQLANSQRRQRGPGDELAPFGGRRRAFSPNVTLQTVEDCSQDSQRPRRRHHLGAVPTAAGDARRGLARRHQHRAVVGSLAALGFGRPAPIGITRFGLVRMILAEAILVGVVACLLSLGFGVTAGYCGTGITRYVNIRGGMITPLIIPWTELAIGFGATLGLCLLAALWPAILTGRAEPLKLLQAGRAAM